MPIKIAINGFGRIGRATFKNVLKSHPKLKVVAINDLTDAKTLAHLLKYDSIYGQYEKKVDFDKDWLIVGNNKFKVLSEKNPLDLPWKKMGVDVVLECTGVFTKLEDAQKHIKAGARKVIISAPCKGDKVPSFVLGVNEGKYSSSKDDVMDMGSCTTNCLAPLVKILNDSFGIVSGFMTTVHSYTTSQRILDLPHKDLRRARAAALNIVPTTTGATKAIAKVIPEIKGKLDGAAIRVPTPIVSVLDFICQVEQGTNVNKVNRLFEKEAKKLKGILRVEKEPLVSTDFIKDTYSCVVDSLLTKVVDGNLVKVSAWYDNEWAYSCRLAEMAEFVGKKL